LDSAFRSCQSRFSDSLISTVLQRDFYERDTNRVARDLLGKILIVRARPVLPLSDLEAGVSMARIVETEAYQGSDPAAHCSRGETPRCSVMFGPGGFAYVYFIYGMYEMLNFVTEPQGRPGAVLIRAVEPLHGEALMRKRTKKPLRIPLREVTAGPGRLTRALGITMSHNGNSLQGPSLYVTDDGVIPSEIMVSPRVGIRAGTDLPWRYFIGDSPFVSKAPQNRLAVRG
jgi:DNA-3-methyladenine glycosylase